MGKIKSIAPSRNILERLCVGKFPHITIPRTIKNLVLKFVRIKIVRIFTHQNFKKNIVRSYKQAILKCLFIRFFCPPIVPA